MHLTMDVYSGITKGDGSITLFQLYTAYFCFIITMVLIVLMLVGFLRWRGQPLKDTFLVVLVVVIFCFLPMIMSIYKIRKYELNREDSLEEDKETEGPANDEEMLKKANEEEDEMCEVFMSIWETTRITELKPWACYATASAEVSFFFLWPVISLFVFENTPVAITFLVLGIHTIPRHYFNASNLLQELGPLDKLDLSDVDMSLLSSSSADSGDDDEDVPTPDPNDRNSEARRKKRRNMKNKALIVNLTRRVTRSRANANWM